MGSCLSSNNGRNGRNLAKYDGSSGFLSGIENHRNTNNNNNNNSHNTQSTKLSSSNKKNVGRHHSISRITLDLNRKREAIDLPEQPVVLPNDPKFHCSINGRNGWKVDEVYDLGESCGKGAFGHIYIATRKTVDTKHPWNKVAIKQTAPTVLDKRGGVRIWTYDNVEDKCQEIKTLILLRENTTPRESCVLYMYEYYWTFNPSNNQGTLHMVTELLGQELDVWRQNQSVLLESTVKKIASVLLNALDYISSRNVVHRDIKLQNILFRKNGDIKSLKLVDFGLAKIIEGNEKASDFCGSLGYMAPEIYEQRPYRYEVDMFAFGIILFRLLSGMRPFSSANNEKLRSDTVNLRYKIEGKNWEGISPNALKLVRKLLIGQQERYTAAEAANHEWFNEKSSDSSVLASDFSLLNNAAPDDDGYSQVIALSQIPAELITKKDGNKFDLDVGVERAISKLQREGKYIGKIVTKSTGNIEGLITVEEIRPDTVFEIPKYIVKLPSYTEKECRTIFREIVSIIKLCHDYGMAHRNLLLTSLLIDDKGKILLRGLHFAQPIVVNQPLTGHFGYLYSWYAFKAPEIDSDLFHDKSVDNWSVGATLYMLLTSLPPFRGDGVELITNKHVGDVVFDMVVPSVPAQNLVRSLLQPDPKKRLSLDQVLNSEWMMMPDHVLERKDLSLTKDFFHDF